MAYESYAQKRVTPCRIFLPSPLKPPIAGIMANSGEVVTYAELDRRSNQAAHLLRASGVNRAITSPS